MEGAPHTAKKQLLCLEVPPPAPVYKGGKGEEADPRARAMGGLLLGLLVLVAPPPSNAGGRGKEREREKERGWRPLP